MHEDIVAGLDMYEDYPEDWSDVTENYAGALVVLSPEVGGTGEPLLVVAAAEVALYDGVQTVFLTDPPNSNSYKGLWWARSNEFYRVKELT